MLLLTFDYNKKRFKVSKNYPLGVMATFPAFMQRAFFGFQGKCTEKNVSILATSALPVFSLSQIVGNFNTCDSTPLNCTYTHAYDAHKQDLCQRNIKMDSLINKNKRKIIMALSTTKRVLKNVTTKCDFQLDHKLLR